MTVRDERMVRDATDAHPDPHLREVWSAVANDLSWPRAGQGPEAVGATE